MINRCIMIFPRFDNMEVIDKLRRQFDPLYQFVPPHITLVFPFFSDIRAIELENHLINSIKGIKGFNLRLHGVTGEAGNYLFLNVVQGQEHLIELQKRLYKGILEQYIPNFLDINQYIPHLTVGHIKESSEFEVAVNNCKAINDIFIDDIKNISVEIIDENENSIIEMTIKLEE
jgi:2'-5' RNA ligase